MTGSPTPTISELGGGFALLDRNILEQNFDLKTAQFKKVKKEPREIYNEMSKADLELDQFKRKVHKKWQK